MFATRHRLSIAPMMDYTDRHCRYLLRLLAPHALLHTEMITTGAILHGDRAHLLGYNPEEHPVALQLGGSDPAELAAAARIGADYGYDEINLNCGCPSDRVKQGRFGACLMAEPQTVAAGVAAMCAAVRVPVTVKTRIGIDHQDSYEALHGFVATVAAAGCRTFIIHARKAWLHGLSPEQNRTVPPLRYGVVYQLKRDFPALCISINGGINSVEQAQEHLRHVDGVMIGRTAIHDAYTVAQMDHALFPSGSPLPSRADIALSYLDYVEREFARGTARLPALTRHLLGLYHGRPGARAWRRTLSTESTRSTARPALIRAALDELAAIAPANA
jgi:tRNA-dihydrouridine synthase A